MVKLNVENYSIKYHSVILIIYYNVVEDSRLYQTYNYGLYQLTAIVGRCIFSTGLILKKFPETEGWLKHFIDSHQTIIFPLFTVYTIPIRKWHTLDQGIVGNEKGSSPTSLYITRP